MPRSPLLDGEVLGLQGNPRGTTHRDPNTPPPGPTHPAQGKAVLPAGRRLHTVDAAIADAPLCEGQGWLFPRPHRVFGQRLPAAGAAEPGGVLTTNVASTGMSASCAAWGPRAAQTREENTCVRVRGRPWAHGRLHQGPHVAQGTVSRVDTQPRPGRFRGPRDIVSGRKGRERARGQDGGPGRSESLKL